jgi:acyl-CoA thioester hydrolase
MVASLYTPCVHVSDPFAGDRSMLSSHEIEIRIRYKETDGQGFVHHANYFVFFEMGRTELFRAAGGNYREMEEKGYFLVVAKLECRYLAPARYDDLLKLRTTVTRITAAKLEHQYELFRNDVKICEAKSMLACIDRTGKVQRIPAAFGGPGD